MVILFCFTREVGTLLVRTSLLAIVRYFFPSYVIPRCINATRIVLVLKIENLVTMNDFRPISCCNMMYKCIFKVIMSILKRIFPNLSYSYYFCSW